MAGKTPFAGERWRVWHLDSELRYRPAVDALPQDDGRPICEVGSGPSGVAGWTERRVIGIDPGDDARHGPAPPAAVPNLVRQQASGGNIPLGDDSVAAALAVDTLEHVPPVERRAIIAEMARVTTPGGRVVLVGPAGAAARDGDSWLLDRAARATPQMPWAHWLREHAVHGLPSVEELGSLLVAAGASRVTARGVFNIHLWRIMHRVGLGDLPRPHEPFYGVMWQPFGYLARHYRRGPFYRWVVVGHM